MTGQTADRPRTWSDTVTPALVALAAQQAAQRPEDYRVGMALCAQYAGRYMHADEVAPVAALMLGRQLAKGLDVVKAASLATYEAAHEVSRFYVRTDRAETPAGDTADVLEVSARSALARTLFTAPDRLTHWTSEDRWRVLTESSDDADASTIVDAMRSHAPDCASTDGTSCARSCGTLAPVARALGVSHQGRAGQALRDRVGQALAGMRSLARTGALDEWERAHAPQGRISDGARDWARDTRVPDSGPASKVIVTCADGTRWIEAKGTRVAVNDAQAQATLLALTEGAFDASKPAEEVKSADLDGAWQAGTMRGAVHPAGVRAGMRYGSGAVAGNGPADSKRTAGGKRKRDGAVGGSMLTGASGTGRGQAGSPTDTGRRASASDALAVRVAGMTPAQAKRYALAARRAEDARQALAVQSGKAPTFTEAPFIGPRPYGL